MAKSKEEKIQDIIENTVEVAEPTPVEATPVTPKKEANVEIEISRRLNKANHKRRDLAQELKKEDTVPVSIAPSYAVYFGRVGSFSINGIAVTVPCDGRFHNVPKTFAGAIYQKMSEIDRNENRGKALSDVQNNVDSSPGTFQVS